ETLAQLDVVGIAVHSHFNLPRREQTERIVRAMQNPHADILFHPTGRVITKREPYDVDIEAVIAAAMETGTVLELDAYPDRLDLLAREREQLVATGYREDVIAECLAAMPIGDAARDVIRHALLWVWKDEEMHTIYVRGALLKLGSLRLRVSSTIQQLTGWIGGWASSVQHHVR